MPRLTLTIDIPDGMSRPAVADTLRNIGVAIAHGATAGDALRPDLPPVNVSPEEAGIGTWLISDSPVPGVR